MAGVYKYWCPQEPDPNPPCPGATLENREPERWSMISVMTSADEASLPLWLSGIFRDRESKLYQINYLFSRSISVLQSFSVKLII